MSLDLLYADGIEGGIQRQLANPGPEPEQSFQAGSFLAAGAKGIPAAGLEVSGSAMDLLAPSANELARRPRLKILADQPDDSARRAREALFFASAGGFMRSEASAYVPDAATAHVADQVIFGLTRVGAKAAAAVVAGGPIAGGAILAAEETNTATRGLIAKGIDPATALKVGAVQGAITGASIGLPMVGSTVAKTVALGIAGGPGGFMAQEEMSKRILSKAGYANEASLHNPFDPLGLALATVLPAAFGGAHIVGMARAKPTLADVVLSNESNGKRYGKDGQLLTSPKGAQGEMQVMPATAKDPGLGVAPAKDDSPDELARVGRDYLAALERRYEGDPAKAMAAYNAGPGALDKALNKHGADWLAHMPDETKAYVNKGLKKLGDDTVAHAAATPEAVDAARVSVDNQAMYRSMPDDINAHAAVLRATDEIAAGRMPEVAPVQPVVLPEPPMLNTPRVPTPEVMAQFGRVEPVPLDIAFGTQAARQWDRFEAGDHPPPVVAGYADKPVAVRMESGEYLVIDGHHRTELAMQAGEKSMPMHVVDAKKYDPENAGRKPVPQSAQLANLRGMSDDELMAELMDFAPQSVAKPPQAPAARPVVPQPRSDGTNTLPRPDSVTLDDLTADELAYRPPKPAKNDGGLSQDAKRVEAIALEFPEMKVQLPGSNKTMSVAEALEQARAEHAADLTETTLVKAALECALGL